MKLSGKNKLIIGFVLLGLFLPAMDAGATLLFFDDFNSGASSAWGNERGSWRDTDGVYDTTNPNNTPPTYSGITTLPSLTDFSVELDVNSLNDGGIWLRSAYNSGNINGVLLVTGGYLGSNNGFYWHTFQNGAASPMLNPAYVPGLQNSNAHLRIEVIGNTYSVFLNNGLSPVTTLTTSLFGTGMLGLYDFSPVSRASSPRGQTFDNVKISDFFSPPPVPEPATYLLFGMGLGGLFVYRRIRNM